MEFKRGTLLAQIPLLIMGHSKNPPLVNDFITWKNDWRAEK